MKRPRRLLAWMTIKEQRGWQRSSTLLLLGVLLLGIPFGFFVLSEKPRNFGSPVIVCHALETADGTTFVATNVAAELARDGREVMEFHCTVDTLRVVGSEYDPLLAAIKTRVGLGRLVRAGGRLVVEPVQQGSDPQFTRKMHSAFSQRASVAQDRITKQALLGAVRNNGIHIAYSWRGSIVVVILAISLAVGFCLTSLGLIKQAFEIFRTDTMRNIESRLLGEQCPRCRYDIAGIRGCSCPECNEDLARARARLKQWAKRSGVRTRLSR